MGQMLGHLVKQQADVYLLPGLGGGGWGGVDFMHVLKKHNALIGDSD